MVLPLPEDPQEFEKMVRDAFALKWKSPNLQIIGRSGQSQGGVDIFGDDELGRPVGIQCKLYKAGLSIKTVEEEVKRAKEFEPPVATLYIATTYPNDSKLQQTVRLLSKERVTKGLFSVGLIFWSDIVAGLVLNRATMQAYYPQLQLKNDPIVDTARLDACLDLGYYGAHIKSFIELIIGELGWMAGEDIRQLEIVLELIENSASRLLLKKQAQAILELTRRVHASLFESKKNALDMDSIISDSAAYFGERDR